MRFGYADPPYPGMSRKYYDGDEVDHAELVATLDRDYPDGWALSTASSTLQEVLALCPAGVRVCCWVKGTRSSSSCASVRPLLGLRCVPPEPAPDEPEHRTREQEEGER